MNLDLHPWGDEGDKFPNLIVIERDAPFSPIRHSVNLKAAFADSVNPNVTAKGSGLRRSCATGVRPLNP
jgi:hypothetical protein